MTEAMTISDATARMSPPKLISIAVNILTGSVVALPAAHEQRDRHFVERDEKGEDGAGHDARPHDRKRDMKERLRRAGAEILRSLLERKVETRVSGQHGADHERYRKGQMADHQPGNRSAERQAESNPRRPGRTGKRRRP